MVELGNYNELKILKKATVGLYLGDEDVDSLLLPNKYIPESYEIGDEIRVFCYLDSEERPVATTLDPYIKRNEFGFLRVAEVSEYGAFLDWGLEKHLLVPFREQQIRMEAGEWYVVFCYLDPKSSRLAASSRLDRFLDNSELEISDGEEVQLLVSRQTDLGWELIVNGRYKGLVYSNEIFRKVSRGDRLTGYVKKIREDNKLDITLEAAGHMKLQPSAQLVYDKLIENNGKLELHDRSDPEDIKAQLQMSKKTFKKAIGILYRERKIVIEKDGIYKI